MMWVMFALAGLFGALSLGCFLIILSQFRHPRKALIIAGWFFGAVLAGVLANSATAVFGPDVSDESDLAAEFDEFDLEADFPEPSEPGSGGEQASDEAR